MNILEHHIGQIRNHLTSLPTTRELVVAQGLLNGFQLWIQNAHGLGEAFKDLGGAEQDATRVIHDVENFSIGVMVNPIDAPPLPMPKLKPLNEIMPPLNAAIGSNVVFKRQLRRGDFLNKIAFSDNRRLRPGDNAGEWELVVVTDNGEEIYLSPDMTGLSEEFVGLYWNMVSAELDGTAPRSEQPLPLSGVDLGEYILTYHEKNHCGGAGVCVVCTGD